MSYPLYWPFKNHYYPIGITSPICLTQYLPVEQAADVLLLGCDDPRNILYTVYADLRPQTARNILLYTLVCSGASLDAVWNIFYHFHLDDQSYELLEAQCHLLATASKSMQNWQCFGLGAYLKMCDSYTLAEMHRHWQLYATFSSKPRSRLDELHAEQKSVSRRILDEHTVLGSVSRSAGMLWPESLKTMNNLYEQYWNTGTTFSCEQDCARSEKLNPSFVYTLAGEKFDPHFATFPLQAFLLTPAFVPDEQSDRDRNPTDIAKGQFRSWCGTFRDAVRSSHPRLVVRFCVSDVVSFPKALHNKPQGIPTRLFTSALSGQALELDGESPPCAFDVIDTSGHVDYSGMVNILVSMKPLLKALPSSVLYTENLVRDAPGADATIALLGRLCGDVSAMSLLIGLTPRSYLSGFNTYSNVHEILFNSDRFSRQFQERVTWCAPASSDPQAWREQPIEFNAKELGALLFKVYDQLCADEKALNPLRIPSLYTLKLMEQQDHDRASLAQLVRLAMSRIVPSGGGWEAVFDVLFKLVEEDPSRLFADYYHEELCLQLHLHGVVTTKSLSPAWRSQLMPNANPRVFCGWADIPPVVCVLLTVPRESLTRAFDGTERLLSMALMCHLSSPGGRIDTFACDLHAIPGRVEPTPGAPGAAAIVRDERGVEGAPSLVVSFLVPAWLLTIPQTQVLFAIRPTPVVAADLLDKLGPMLEIFSAHLTDKRHVCVARERPGVFADPRASDVLPAAPRSRALSSNRVAVKMDGRSGRVGTMTFKLDLAAMGFSSPLEPSLPIAAEQTGACTMEVTVGDKRGYARYPFPIKGSEHRLRIARRSLYVEVIVPPFSQPKGAGRTLDGNMFPVIKTAGLTPWNVHHVSLDIAPILDFKGAEVPAWLIEHILCQHSEREMAVPCRLDPSVIPEPQPEALTGLKQSIRMIFDAFHGLPQNRAPARIFQFVERGTTRPFMLIFVRHVRLDLSSFTLLADAAVVPLVPETSHTLDEALRSLPGPLLAPFISLLAPEAIAWRQLLPAVVERCRTWPHKPNCEYASESDSGRIPVSVQWDASPLCGCGHGIGLPDAMPGVPATVWQAARPLATRAAISLLFAVSYLEPVVAGGIAAEAHEAAMAALARRRAADLGVDIVVSSRAGPSTQAGPGKKCRVCGGPGKPKLRVCGRCKQAKYCSPDCSRADWETHKVVCRRT
ncbi:hypothetical protein EVJ58_g2685 [Rhodofomes roseus]|uniref:MYND-type domain-containing protein n=1 Tax=Rhodofomes roseus TaxID=34475 RepID=A0A4Y9YQC3_9APHY|nr:hypothetical protein EVJ58_g2685 [Rhodofomes roseus]